MRKTFKKAVVTALTTVMALSSIIAINPKEAKADVTEYDMYFGIGAGNEWQYQYNSPNDAANAGDITSTAVKVKEGDTVTVGVTLPEATDKIWWMAPVIVAEDAANLKVDFTLDKVTFDGTDVTDKVDLTVRAEGISWAEDTGEYKGNAIRLAGGYNEWGDKFVTPPASVKEIMYTITVKTIAAATTEGEGETEAPAGSAFDPKGEYNAYLGIQTPNWTYRNAWNTYEEGSELWGDFIYGNETSEKYGKVTDAVIKGNGTYKVSLTDFGTIIADDFTTAKQDYFNLLFISTDIPLSEDVKVTDVKIIMDGKTIKTYDEAVLDADDKEYVKILIQNVWNDTVKELPYYAAPTTSVEMQFTIEGFDYDNPDAEEETPAPTTKAPVKDDANTDSDDDKKEDGGFPVVPVVIVVIVVVVAIVAIMMGKKKKA